MRTFDLSPLFRSSVGFDRMMNQLENSAWYDESENSYPPYNIEKTGEYDYRISMAVAGFSEDELTLETRDNTLLISGERRRADDGERRYLYQGIPAQSFRRTFQLADHVKVTGARLDKGLLFIELVREVPEEMKPRRIEINAASHRTLTEETSQARPELKQAS